MTHIVKRACQPYCARGFTIVELLIVIVVVAILASIAIISYSGIQDRADNARRITAAQNWVKLFNSYVTANGKYPANQGWYCIGETNITTFDSNPDIDCGVSNNVKHDDSTLTTTLNTEIRTLGALPQFPGEPVQVDSSLKGSGLLLRFETNTADSKSYPTLIFFLRGSDQDCAVRPLVTPWGGGNFTVTSAKNSYSSVGTACRVMLSNPTNL